MKPETIKRIRSLLKMDVDDRKDRLMRIIESGSDIGLTAQIVEYRNSYNALDDFDDWVDKQEGDQP